MLEESALGSASALSSQGLGGFKVMKLAIEALEASLLQGWPIEEPPRTVLKLPGGQLLLMSSWNQTGMGVKVITVREGSAVDAVPRIQGVFILFRRPAMTPALTIDAAALTALRTPALSAVATKYLAASDASRLLVFGSGPQAAGHVIAMSCIRRLRSISIVGSQPAKAEILAAELRRQGFPARAADLAAVRESDIICTCTNSRSPVFDGQSLPKTVHINAIGSHEPHSRELDDATFRGAEVVVENRDVAQREAGDIILAQANGALRLDAELHELAEVVRGTPNRSGVRRSIFKSVGTAGQDLVVAQMLSAR